MDNEVFGIIYCITNKINNKKYIGKRLKKYLNRFDDYYGSGKIIKNAINKYGKENFEKTILCECFSNEELNKKEKVFIVEFNTIRPNGYNIAEGGNGGNTLLGMIEEEKNKVYEKMKKARKITYENNKEHYNEIFSKTAKNNLKNSINFGFKKGRIPHNKGKKYSEELKEKLSIIHKGHKISEEQKIKQSKSMKNKNGREIMCVETKNIYLSVQDLKDKMNISLKNSTIYYRIKHNIEIEGFNYTQL